jgi:hypothetical protein
MENFEVNVTIPEIFNEHTYLSQTNCYLARVLKEKFPNSKVLVKGFGECEIDEIKYIPLKETPFNIGIAKQSEGKTLTIKFKKGSTFLFSDK